ncbi:MAG: site-specific integrase [Ignavibacteriales bacterium]|nr:site-specific integrase [Ignavibacteriales bacterium]
MSNKKFYLTKRNNGIYYVGWHEGDKLRWKTTKCNKKSDAISFLNSFKVEEIDADVIPLLSELWQLYSTTKVQCIRTRTIEGYQSAVKSFITLCGDKQLDKYSLQDVEQFKHFHLSRGLSPHTVNISYRAVKTLFNFGIRHEYILKSPFSKSSQIKTPQRLPVYMSSEDFQKLLSVVDEQILRDIFTFAALTGMRLNEITNLRWSNVDFKKNQMTLENTDTFTTKSGKIRTVPMHGDVVSILQRIQKEQPALGYVFCKRSGYKFAGTYVSHKFKKSVRLAKLNEALHFHSLRHTCASHLVSAGVSLYVVQNILGHSNVSTTMIYSHLSPSSLQDSINKIAL